MSTTARHAIKPKVLTLLELCQSVSDFRQLPLPSTTPYNYQFSSNTAQILTRRLYLHPLTINPNARQQQLSKITTSTANSPDFEHRRQSNAEKHRDTRQKKKKSSQHDLTVLSTSLPLISRINPKSDVRHSREKVFMQTDDDLNSDLELSTTSNTLNQPSLTSFTRKRLSKARPSDTHPSVVVNQQKIYKKPSRVEKINVWHHLDQTLERPLPIDPPTTPLGSDSNFNVDNNPSDSPYVNYYSIDQMYISKRNQLETSVTDDENEYDHLIYDEEE